MRPEHCGTGRAIPGKAGLAHMIVVAAIIMGQRHPQLEAPTRLWYQCADTRLDPCPRPSRYCVCSEAPYGCGSCCSCLSGCIEQHDETELWAKRLREMRGQLEPCLCWYGPNRLPGLNEPPRPPVFSINPSCPHHGDARITPAPEGCTCRDAPGWYPGRPAAAGCPVHEPHRCNTAALSRSRHQEGTGWRCPTCGVCWTLTRTQEVDPCIRLYPTLQWIRDAPEGN